MHSQGFGRKIIQWMQSFEESTGRIGVLNCLKKLYMEDCEVFEEFPSGICTLKALEKLSFRGCKSWRGIPEGLGELS